MSALDDAKRFLWLGPEISTDDPIEILKNIVDEYARLPKIGVDSRVRLESKIAELEAQVKQANDRTRAVEHRNVQLEEQLKSDRLWKRIQELETQLKKANERTRIVEHQLVIATEQGSANRPR